MKRPSAQFPEPNLVGPREWGEELLLVLSSGKFTMKRLSIREGSRGGLQYHRRKEEAGYVVSGKLMIRYEHEAGLLTDKLLSAGDWFHFPAGSIHQEIALTDVVIIEVSTPHFNDRVRAESLFGLEEASGLPSTNESDIVIK